MKTVGTGSSRKAFVFSLDSFMAFSLVLITIYSLLVMVNLPKGYYSTLEQSYDLAKDTLTVLEHSKYPTSGTGETYMQRLHHAYAQSGTADMGIARDTVGAIIPVQWGYIIEYSSGDTPGVWSTVYDTRNDLSSQNHHSNVKFRKVQSSATTIVSSYKKTPNTGTSPYCYLTLIGLPAGQTTCDTPCDVLNTTSNDAGDSDIGLIRITVFT